MKKRTKRRLKLWLPLLLVAGLVGVTAWYLGRHSIPVLQPRGPVGAKERNLIVFCASISVVIVAPVFGLLGYFAWQYRESNVRAKYSPEVDGSRVAETIWWVIPGILIAVISVITWRSSYALDPFKPLSSAKPPLHIQVVSMDWKWLFIYPDQHVASINEAAIPVGTPVDFELTSDSVMSSFWVPQLGGQMYTMPGMSTQLNLQAAKPGDYRGLAANISGKGFADMTFTVKAVSGSGFDAWQRKAQSSNKWLSSAMYSQLTRPGIEKRPRYYASVEPSLYDTIVMKYMMPMGEHNTNMTMHGMTQ